MIQCMGAAKYYEYHYGLQKTTITFQPGQVVGLFGKNGSGKTTLLKAIMNLLPLSEGWIQVDGKPVGSDTYQKLVYVGDECSAFMDMNGKEHEEFYAWHYPRFQRDRYKHLCEYFELPLGIKVRQYSKGQKAKLDIAIGFSKGGSYLLLDEPFLGNDMFTRSDFLKMMSGFMEESGIVIIATHLLEEVENFIDRAIFLDNGKIVEDCLMDSIREEGDTLIARAKRVFAYEETSTKLYRFL